MKKTVTTKDVMHLVRRGYSQRKIAAVFGVSRRTIENRIRKHREQSGKPASKPDGIVYPNVETLLRPIRCPECGGLVQAPCLACQIRKLAAQSRAKTGTSG